jgi:hypothetical protein
VREVEERTKKDSEGRKEGRKDGKKVNSKE